MGYLVILLILLVGIFVLGTSGISITDLFDRAKDTAAQLVPKSEKEVLIENLEQQHSILERFFARSAPTLGQNSALTSEQKQELQQAAEAFKTSERLASQLEEVVQREEKTTTTLIKSIFPVLQKESSNSANCKP